MRLRGAKRPGIDAIIAIATSMEVSVDWLVGLSNSPLVSDQERPTVSLAVYKLLMRVLRDIEKAQLKASEPLIRDGKIGPRELDDYAIRMMLFFTHVSQLLPQDTAESFFQLDQHVQESSALKTGN